MMLVRAPRPPLRPFVTTLWAVCEQHAPARPRRERVLPTGHMHLVVRLADAPLRVFPSVDAPDATVVGRCVVGGARPTWYVRDVAAPSWCVGAQLRPGAARVLLGVPADELAGRHVALDDLWGAAAAQLRSRLQEAGDPARQLDLFETLLAARLPVVQGLHPAVAETLARLRAAPDVRAAVAATGYSHRRVVALFREAVGLGPKLFVRVRRFQRVLDVLQADAATPWAAVALDAGYADQAHLVRDFREFSGITPGAHRRLAPVNANHVPVPGEVNSVQDAATATRENGRITPGTKGARP